MIRRKPTTVALFRRHLYNQTRSTTIVLIQSTIELQLCRYEVIDQLLTTNQKRIFKKQNGE
jgi:hypothetical protein